MEIDNKKVEVELRGLLSKEQFDLLSTRLEEQYHGDDDNKETYFYVTNDFILKIETRDNPREIFLIVKDGDETKNVLEELEVKFDSSDLPNIIRIFDILGYSKINIVKQKRRNYLLEDNVVLSLKYTEDWGYHFEIEKIVGLNDAEKTKKLLADRCKSLNLRFMDGPEIAEKINEINKKHGYI